MIADGFLMVFYGFLFNFLKHSSNFTNLLRHTMSLDFTLIIHCNLTQVELDLRDEGQHSLVKHSLDLGQIAARDQLGLFNLRGYLDDYVLPEQEAPEIARIGVCIAHNILGLSLFRFLVQGEIARHLYIQLPQANPSATAEANWFARAMARVPWEIAREQAHGPSLYERNLSVRIIQSAPPALPALPSLPVLADEEIRILFVFAQAQGAQALLMRQERQALQQLFAREIYPKRRVRAWYLSDGVTRGRLAETIARHQGFHIVHWSGHGALHTLELAGWEGKPDFISAADLLDMFKRGAGFLPQLLYLSACQSGQQVQQNQARKPNPARAGQFAALRDWQQFTGLVENPGQNTAQNARRSALRDIELPDVNDLGQAPAYTRGALALLRSGIPALVAMRYAVADDFARELALAFYRALLADVAPRSIFDALQAAQKSLQGQRCSAADLAAPLLFGLGQRLLVAGEAPSSALRQSLPWHHIAELHADAHPRFVGRIHELARLGRCFIGSQSDEVQPLTVIVGVAGVGKTALAAEALALWQDPFELVLHYQAKPNRLDFEATLQDLHGKLWRDSPVYRQHLEQHPHDAIFRPASERFAALERQKRLIRNLVRCLHCQCLMLVLDNFETNLKAQGGAEDQALACIDPAWDALLQALAQGLPGSPSRVLITCRRPIAALQAASCYPVWLQPLAAPEAALYVRQNFSLRQMLLGSGSEGRDAILRIMQASRFHPLLLDRLTRLVTDPGLRQQFWLCLQALEADDDFAKLPPLLDATPEPHWQAIHYLQQALLTSLNHLLVLVGPDARCLLWMIALANESVELWLLKLIWRGISLDQERLLKYKQMRDELPHLPPEKQRLIQNLSAKMHTALDHLPPPPVRPNFQPVLNDLLRLGLIKSEPGRNQDEAPRYACHDLVRERMVSWMASQTEAGPDFSRQQIKQAYAERLLQYFDELDDKTGSDACLISQRVLVYCQEAGESAKLADFMARLEKIQTPALGPTAGS
ncbi:MAG: hypothetical protein RL748_2953 [Pseudomonadota bacterium]